MTRDFCRASIDFGFEQFLKRISERKDKHDQSLLTAPIAAPHHRDGISGGWIMQRQSFDVLP
jgi:hypothetical protein